MAQINVHSDINLNKNALVQMKFENLPTAPTAPIAGQVYFNSTDNRLYCWNGTLWVDLSQVLSGAVTIRGEISNANTNPSFPASPGVGDMYFVTTNAGTIGGVEVEIGDQLIYGTSGFFVMQKNVIAATTAIAGLLRLATQAEANAGSLTNATISPATLAGFLINFLYAKKFRTNVASLIANTPTIITHGLNLANAEDLNVTIYQGGNLIRLSVKPTTINSITIESNQALSNVVVVCQG